MKPVVRIMIKYIFLIIFLSCASSVVLAGTDGIIAIVNNEVITQNDLNAFINFMRMQMSSQYSEDMIQQNVNQMLPDLISRLIEDRLILQAAYKENITIDSNRIKARIEQIRKKYSNEADFQKALTTQGLTLADLELKIKEQLLMFEIIDKKIKSKIVLKPQEISDYYYAHAQDFNGPEQREVRFAIIKDSNLVQKLKTTISEYKDLDAIARSHPIEITDLGWVTSKQLKEDIAEMVFNLEAGRLSPILEQDRNFYIFEVKAIRPSEKKSLFDVQEEISQLLFEEKMQEALVKWLEELKEGSYIEIKKNEYGAS